MSETFTREDMASAYKLGYEHGNADGDCWVWSPENPWKDPEETC